jgi:hypothetical protein
MTEGTGVIVVTTDEDPDAQGNIAAGNMPAGPEAGPTSNDTAADVPQATAPTGSESDAPAPANQPAPAPPPEFGETAGFWTFGFDMVVEHRHENGEGEGQQPEGTQRDEGRDADMTNNDEDSQEGEARREAQALAEQFLDQIGFTMGPGPGPPTNGESNNRIGEQTRFTQVFGIGGNNDAPPGGNGAQPANPMAGFAQMFTGAMGDHNGPAGPVPGGIHVMPPQWQPQNANTGPPPAGQQQPGGGPPAGAGPDVPTFAEFRQMFGFPDANGAGDLYTEKNSSVRRTDYHIFRRSSRGVYGSPRCPCQCSRWRSSAGGSRSPSREATVDATATPGPDTPPTSRAKGT